MAARDVRKLPQRHRQRVRVVAVIVAGAFALPELFVFGVTLRELSTPAITSANPVPEGASPSTEVPPLPLPPLPEAP